MLLVKAQFQVKSLTNAELERQVSELNTALMTSSQTPDEPNVGAPQVAAGAESDGEASDKT